MCVKQTIHSGVRLLICLLAATLLAQTNTDQAALAQTTPYARAGWQAELSTLAHGVDGIVEIVDERTIRISNFDYDGGGPAVYAYLGVTNDQSDFENGLRIGPLLSRPGQPYVDETVELQLPADGPTLDGYTAISIWCVDFRVNFGSGAFTGPQLYLPVVQGE